MKTIITIITLTAATAAHATQPEIKGFWTNGKECVPVYRCTSDLECEQLNPHIPENIKGTHVFVTDKDQCGNHEEE